ncbi:MAG: tetratricopeptide repeat protein [Candidatus Omnitrophota bacterium]
MEEKNHNKKFEIPASSNEARAKKKHASADEENQKLEKFINLEGIIHPFKKEKNSGEELTPENVHEEKEKKPENNSAHPKKEWEEARMALDHIENGKIHPDPPKKNKKTENKQLHENLSKDTKKTVPLNTKLIRWGCISLFVLLGAITYTSIMWNLSLQHSIKEIKTKAVSNAEIAKKMVGEKERLVEKYKPLNEQLAKIKNELTSVKDLSDNLKKQNDELTSELSKTKDKFFEFQTKIKGYADEVKGLATKRIKYYDAYSSEKEHKEKLVVSLKNMENKVKELNTELTAVDNEYLAKEKNYVYDIAFLYARAGMFNEAIQSFLKFLELDNDNADAHYNLAMLYEHAKKDKIKAVKHYNHYLALNPDAEDLYEIKMRVNSLERVGSETKYLKDQKFEINLDKLKY